MKAHFPFPSKRTLQGLQNPDRSYNIGCTIYDTAGWHDLQKNAKQEGLSAWEGCTGSVIAAFQGVGAIHESTLGLARASPCPRLICPMKLLGPCQTEAQTALHLPLSPAQHSLWVQSSSSRSGNPGLPHCYIPAPSLCRMFCPGAIMPSSLLCCWHSCHPVPVPSATLLLPIQQPILLALLVLAMAG